MKSIADVKLTQKSHNKSIVHIGKLCYHYRTRLISMAAIFLFVDVLESNRPLHIKRNNQETDCLCFPNVMPQHEASLVMVFKQTP